MRCRESHMSQVCLPGTTLASPDIRLLCMTVAAMQLRQQMAQALHSWCHLMAWVTRAIRKLLHSHWLGDSPLMPCPSWDYVKKSFQFRFRVWHQHERIRLLICTSFSGIVAANKIGLRVWHRRTFTQYPYMASQISSIHRCSLIRKLSLVSWLASITVYKDKCPFALPFTDYWNTGWQQRW